MARLAVLAATIALANAQIKICTSPPVWEGACVAANRSHPLPPSSMSQQVCTHTHEHTHVSLAHMSAHTVTAPTALRKASPVFECAHQSGSVLATPVTSFLIWPLILRDACRRNAAPAHTEDVCHKSCITAMSVHPCMHRETDVTPLQSPAIHSAKPRVRHCARRDHHGAVLV